MVNFVIIRCDELKRQYVGAQCGLGFDPSSGCSIFPEHDIEIIFDTLITQEHISQVGGAGEWAWLKTEL